MESIIPSRYPILRLRKCVLALTVGLAAILLPAAVDFAQLENQDQINRAVKAYEASTKQAVENIPDSEVMKRREILGEIPATAFQGAKTWQVRVLIEHTNGAIREARLKLNLG